MIFTKILTIIFIFCCLNVIRHGYYFIQALLTSTEETDTKYRLTPTSLILLGVSISYILTLIITGFKL
jgi:hypothetical protein